VIGKAVPSAIVIIVMVPMLVAPVTIVVVIAMIFIGVPREGNACGNCKKSNDDKSEPLFYFQGRTSEAMK
jgi:hypothetical protein